MNLFLTILLLTNFLYAIDCTNTSQQLSKYKVLFDKKQHLLSLIESSFINEDCLSNEEQFNIAHKRAYSLSLLGQDEISLIELSAPPLNKKKKKNNLSLKKLNLLVDIYKYNISHKTNSRTLKNLIETNKNNLKSPQIASALSALLPGSGQIYNGDYQAGFIAFFLNAIFIGSTIELFNEDSDFAGSASGFAALTFYLGNIYSAYTGSIEQNRAINEQSFRIKMEKEYPSLYYNIKF